MRYLKGINEFFTTKEALNPNTLDSRINQFESNIKKLIKSDDYRQDDLIDYFEDIKSILESDCSEFINELKNSGNHLLYRGIKRLNVSPIVEDEKTLDGFYKKQSRKNRYTLDIEPSISETFDGYFQQKFDIRLRSNGVFATKDPLAASSYSQYDSKIKSRKAFMFFPIGSDYLYFWNPNIWDLFSDIEGENWYYRANLDEDGLYYEYSDVYGDPREGTYRNLDNGHFQLFGHDLKGFNKFNIIKHIIDNKEKFGLKSNGIGCYTKDDRIIICDNSGIKNVSDLKWIPDLTFEEWLKENKLEEPYEHIANIVDGYQEGNLDKIKKQEITFITDNYYILDEKYYFLVKDWLFS